MPLVCHRGTAFLPSFEIAGSKSGSTQLVVTLFWLLFHLGGASRLETEGKLQVAWPPLISGLPELAFGPVP